MDANTLPTGVALLQSFLPSSLTDASPQPLTIINLFLQAAVESPYAEAVVWAGGSLTFAELDERSTAVAERLRVAGLDSNVAVGLYLESSAELIVAALGVWKAGGAYLPIDPAYPADRATFILTDSGTSLLITSKNGGLPSGLRPWKTLLIEDMLVRPAGVTVALPAASLDDLAYLIYTSGSTGKPKGVEITHRNLLNLVEWHRDAFSITRNDRGTQIAGPGFDASVWEVWPYLAAGAAVHLPASDARVSAVRLRDWLIREEITVSFVPTVLAEELLHLAWPATTTLRFLLTGGDALHSFPPPGLPFRLVNNYGPTECTVVATSSIVREAEGLASPTIGSAIANTSLYLLDEAGRPVADGEIGELYVGGASVGRGYRNQPELTAARFVAITREGKTERTFRTGDLVRQLADGQLSFVGRADDQVKIRGFRIEPDEIASVINRHPGVVSSAVIARQDKGEKRLVAYIVATAGTTLGDQDLRDLLTRSLPDYMVPAIFVQLEHIPVTANGKVDKEALPAPTENNQLRRSSYVAPRSELEQMVEGILGPILGLDRVSIHDNFFLLGGHSLMGAQVIAKVRDIFDVELNLRNVFESPTVAKLASKIEASLTARLEAMSEEEVHQALREHGPLEITRGVLPAKVN